MSVLAKVLGRLGRPLRTRPLLTVAAVTCLALGIGANTAVYSVLHSVLLRPLPFAEPERLAMVWSLYPGADGVPTEYFTTTENFVEFGRASSFEAIVGVLDLDFDILNQGSDPARVFGAEASHTLFRVTGTRPILGRLFGPDDAIPGRDRVVVIREDVWERRFAGAPSVIGEELVVDGVPRTIIGVVAMRSAFPLRSTVWIPLVPDGMTQERRERGMLTVVGRLSANTSFEAAQDDMAALAGSLRDLNPVRNPDLGLRVERLHSTLAGDSRPVVLGLMVAVGLLLAIACANVANLRLVRLDRDRWQIALRLSLGATPRHVVMHSLREGFALALVGGAGGVVLAYAALDPLVAMAPQGTHGLDDVALSTPVLGFSLIVSLLTVLASGVAPALLASRTAPQESLQPRSAGSGFAATRLQARFVMAQAGVGVALLVTAGLTVKALSELQRVDPGFDTDAALTFRLTAPPARYPDHRQRVSFFTRVLEEIRVMPGVESVAGAHVLPIGDVAWGFAHSVEDHPPADPREQNISFLRVVTPGYFETMRTAFVEGRDFRDQDDLDHPRVAVVSHRVAQRYWPNGSAVGKRIKHRAHDSDNPWITVVGVVQDVRDGGLEEDPSLTIYLPLAQQDVSYAAFMSVVVRAAGPVVGMSGIAARVRRIDPNVALFRVRSLEAVVSDSLEARRFSAVLLGLFAILGLVLTAVGVYGVIEQAAGQRRHEMAIRLALGATEGKVMLLLLRRALGLAAAGASLGLLAVGLLGFWPATSALQLRDPDLWVLLGAPFTVCVMAVLACIRPSWKAATIPPAGVLRGG
jgi:putative ABC transport system permease protein